MRSRISNKLLTGLGIILLFFIFNSGSRYLSKWSSDDEPHTIQSHILKIPNRDASLTIPYLDSINTFWHVGGSTEIRNTGSIRLSKSGRTNDYGIVISNGIGDNTMNNLEVIIKFSISPFIGKVPKSRNRHIVGDGMAIVLTSDNDFITQDLHSSYARKQYDINSGGVNPANNGMMGFPSNLPGMALIIDTYQNVPNSRKITPLMDAILNVDPRSQSYDIESDGLKTTALKLNEKLIRLKENVVLGDTTKLRVIYLESIKFLKVDIQYEQEGNYWIELFQKNNIVIPKNAKTGQRYIGLGALTGSFSETIDVLEVSTNEFHWKNRVDINEDTEVFAEEMRRYFINEYEDRLALETDKFQRWKMLKSQPHYLSTTETGANIKNNKTHSSTSIFLAFCILAIILYMASVYIRVCVRHTSRVKTGILCS